ncbi:putative solanesyl-diphosphate synthase 3, chloroplastic [Iris pallida]|uniref:Solanesyl-diphosphate synthase 3, chloroplastic n=1 Tax=Iris pallida TaxID=29817 RepID=A0AAX6E6E5_IRIPA|nr:putative solanesyl-diphosphate synthase 3, chloroplastic [Iris pallida]
MPSLTGAKRGCWDGSSGSHLDVGTSAGPSGISVSVALLMEPVSEDLLRLNNNLKTVSYKGMTDVCGLRNVVYAFGFCCSRLGMDQLSYYTSEAL